MSKRICPIFILLFLILSQSVAPAAIAQGRPSPGAVQNASGPTLTSAKAIASGENFSCILTVPGKVKCWGNNQGGKLGIDSNVEIMSAPIEVQNLDGGVQAIAVGDGHACRAAGQRRGQMLGQE